MAFSPEVCAAAANLGRDTCEDLCRELSRRYHIVRSAGTQRFPHGQSARLTNLCTHSIARCYIGRWRHHVEHTCTCILGNGWRLFRAHLSKVAAELVPHFEEFRLDPYR